MRGAHVADTPHSLGALKKMFYHDICHETIHGFAAPGLPEGGGFTVLALSELILPGYHAFEACCMAGGGCMPVA